MIGFTETRPDTGVQAAEYRRLLGYPPAHEPDQRALELMELARCWYAAHGRPWVHARQAADLDLATPDVVGIEGVRFTTPRLHRMLVDAGADAVVLVAVSAGPELEEEAARRWHEEKPDEYFFLEILGSALVEHLVTMTGARLCAAADERGRAVLPHYSPGYPGWDIAQQATLADLVRGGGAAAAAGAGALPGPLEVLESGMLRPKKSLLAVFGLTAHTERVRRLTDLVPCENCTLPGCRYRRAPYTGPRLAGEVERMTAALAGGSASPAVAPPLTLDARYSVAPKALRRWADERLTLTRHADGSTDALFRYEGSTCTDMGRAFRFHYAVKLAPRSQRYRILDTRCAPAPGDEGHAFMCRIRNSGPRLLDIIAGEQPLLGEPLDAVLSWQRAPGGATCYCETGTHAHKWGLALETIHFALARGERARAAEAGARPGPAGGDVAPPEPAPAPLEITADATENS